MSTSEPYPLYSALRGILGLEVNFTGYGYPRQKHFRGRLDDLVKFTFWPHPLYSALRGTLTSEVNVTGRGNPCQKCFKGRFANLVKFTF